ncbi:PQQ-dependent sugar dehydrogenase [Thalassotalea mangrovi]|uniref:PQQ-dependent sugar dehydrogenase n=1 Tax=Thalassotalea mangrovi TaxID=2572245 RepID=A0A4U1B2W7_9GAMM|nr:PQQ-dependent sugar dehydrogenase [Thalassotalea mangrovi]TKB43999.1 PQQ-dependent sugar dehydrogenase [Thalassotalea mangrovi]
MLNKFALKLIATALLAGPVLSVTAMADTGPEIVDSKLQSGYQAVLVADGIDIPWGMVQLPNGDLLVTEREGKIKIIRDGKLLEQTVSGLPDIHNYGQGGLLDIALDPNYEDNGWLYFTYSTKQGEAINTALMRAKLQDLNLVDKQLLYKAEGNSDKRQHFGSRIVFDKNGDLFFSIGDRGMRDENPQDLSLDSGKIYRIKADGSIPADNPFVDSKDAKPAIYSYGHRNPQGMAMDPATGNIWATEHGPKGGDEVNLIRDGRNYGWPVISYGVNYSGTSFTELTEKEGMEQPKINWTPSLAPSGLTFVSSDKYPQWQGKMLAGSMKFNYLVLISVDGDKVVSQEKLFKDVGRVRNVYQAPDGFIYLGIDGQGIKKIVPVK